MTMLEYSFSITNVGFMLQLLKINDILSTLYVKVGLILSNCSTVMALASNVL